MEDGRVTSAITVPETLASVCDHVANRGSPSRRTLRFVGVGGAIVPPDLLRRARALGIPAYEGYGLTEACSVVTLNTEGADRVGTVGRPLAHVRVRVAEDGEVHVAGALCGGYLGRPEGPCGDGSWATGDLGELDPEGFLHLRGRKRNVLVTSFGRNVSPEWLESRLLSVPEVRQAVVFGDGLPRPVPVVVPRQAEACDDPRWLDDLNASLPDYARLARPVLASEPFDVGNGQWTSTGRPRRHVIERAYRDAIHERAAELSPSRPTEVSTHDHG